MAKYDPSTAEEFESKRITGGRKVLHVVGYKRAESKNGNPMINVGVTCLSDLEHKGEEGAIGLTRFMTSGKALFRFGLFCQAVGHLEPFDTDDDDEVESILTKGPFIAVMKGRTYNGKEQFEISKFLKYEGDYDPEWNEAIEAGEVEYARLLEVFAKASADRANGSGGGYSGGGYSGSGGGNSPMTSDDIPF